MAPAPVVFMSVCAIAMVALALSVSRWRTARAGLLGVVAGQTLMALDNQSIGTVVTILGGCVAIVASVRGLLDERREPDRRQDGS